MQRTTLLIMAKFSLHWFSQPWTLPTSIYPVISRLQNELSPGSSKDKPLFLHQSPTLICRLCRALTQTKAHSETSPPVLALKFRSWLLHTASAVLLHLALSPSLRAGAPSSSACGAQLNQRHGDVLLWVSGQCLPFLPLLSCKLKRDG